MCPGFMTLLSYSEGVSQVAITLPRAVPAAGYWSSGPVVMRRAEEISAVKQLNTLSARSSDVDSDVGLGTRDTGHR